MNNRPPTPSDSELVTRAYNNEDEWNCMQEALTCEWLIEKYFMPDPTQFISYSLYIDEIGEDVQDVWHLEDKTQ